MKELKMQRVILQQKLKAGTNEEVPIQRGLDFLSNIDQTKYAVGNKAKNRGDTIYFYKKSKTN